MSAVRVLCLAFALALLLGTTAQAETRFSGWAQFRATDWDRDLSSHPDRYDLRRMRLTVQQNFSARTGAKLQIEVGGFDDTDASRAIEYKDAYLYHDFDRRLSATAGFTSASFGIEVPASNSKLLPFERSQAALKLFPGERETGLYLHYTPAGGWLPAASVGYTEGMTKWWEADKSGNEDHGTDALVARVQWPLPRKGVIGASYRAADRTREIGGVDQSYSDDLLGLHLRYNSASRWAVQGEYYDGEDLGVDVSGWYGQFEYALGCAPVTAFYRHDLYDFGGADDYDRDTAGLAWACSKTEQVTLQGETYEDGKGACFVNWGLQYQVSY